MLVSILHRITGDGLSIVGGLVLLWWLWAAASGREAYEAFAGHATSWYGIVIGVGLSWAFFQHMASGVRHLFMDAGANFELGANKRTAMATFFASGLLTAAFWAFIILEKSNG